MKKSIIFLFLTLCSFTLFGNEADIPIIRQMVRDYSSENFSAIIQGWSQLSEPQSKELTQNSQELFRRNLAGYLYGSALGLTGHNEEAIQILIKTITSNKKESLPTLLAQLELYSLAGKTGNRKLAETIKERILKINDFQLQMENWIKEANGFQLARFDNELLRKQILEDWEKITGALLVSADKKEDIPDEMKRSDNSLFSEKESDEGLFFLENYYPFLKICTRKNFRSPREAEEYGNELVRQKIIASFLLRKYTADGPYFLQTGAYLNFEIGRREESAMEKAAAKLTH